MGGWGERCVWVCALVPSRLRRSSRLAGAGEPARAARFAAAPPRAAAPQTLADGYGERLRPAHRPRPAVAERHARRKLPPRWPQRERSPWQPCGALARRRRPSQPEPRSRPRRSPRAKTTRARRASSWGPRYVCDLGGRRDGALVSASVTLARRWRRHATRGAQRGGAATKSSVVAADGSTYICRLGTWTRRRSRLLWR